MTSGLPWHADLHLRYRGQHNNGQVSYAFDNVGNRLQRDSSVPAIPATGLLNYDANDRTATDPYTQTAIC